MTRVYVAVRRDEGCTVTRIRDDVTGAAKYQPLRRRLDLANHSPTGFEWGYAGSGPAQLALALLADALGDDRRALALHQQFKDSIVAKLPRDGWQLSARDVEIWAQVTKDASGT